METPEVQMEEVIAELRGIGKSLKTIAGVLSESLLRELLPVGGDVFRIPEKGKEKP